MYLMIGHVDPGESETDRMATAIRETEEESGLRVEQYELDNKYGPVELKVGYQLSSGTLTSG